MGGEVLELGGSGEKQPSCCLQSDTDDEASRFSGTHLRLWDVNSPVVSVRGTE